MTMTRPIAWLGIAVLVVSGCAGPAAPANQPAADAGAAGAPAKSAVEAVDSYKLAVYFPAPYFQGAVLGPFLFWPLPRHLLEPAYPAFLTTKNPDEVLNSSYWTSGYVHLGPFRLTAFDPGNELTFQAYDGYFLGKPRVGTIHVRIF